MGKEDRYQLENLLKSAESLVSGIDLDNLLEVLPEDKKKSLKDEIIDKEVEDLRQEASPVIDGTVEIKVSKDCMTASADFSPPSGEGKPIDEWDVRNRLADLGIVHGIDFDAVKEKIAQCNAEHLAISDAVVARGSKPEDEVPQHLVLSERLARKPEAKSEGKDSLDYRELTSYTLVKKGENLARVVPAKPGQFGKTVKGEIIPYQKAKVPFLEPGKNTAVEDDRIIAVCDGKFELKGSHFSVHEVFEVHENVDYRTGNISFPGDVIIHGQVSDGFAVKAGGSIFCRGTLDASEILCERDLVVNRGIIGKRRGRASVGASVSAKYIENCYLEAKGPIHVQSGILHSIIHTLDMVEMGSKSVIIGGKVFAQNGVKAYQVGNTIGIKTEIYCGTDFTIQQRLDWIKDKTVALAKKLGQINELLKKDPRNEELILMRDKLKDAVHKMNAASKSLFGLLYRQEDATLLVKGTIYPGVYIEICNVSYLVPHEMHGVKFFLDRERRKIDTSLLL